MIERAEFDNDDAQFPMARPEMEVVLRLQGVPVDGRAQLAIRRLPQFEARAVARRETHAAERPRVIDPHTIDIGDFVFRRGAHWAQQGRAGPRIAK